MSKQLRFIGLVLTLIQIAVSALATEITVRKDGTGDFLTINDAVAAAAANDTITVGPGTYAEPFIEVEIPLFVRSESGPSMTLLDGQGTNRIFRFRYGVGTTVEGFTFAYGRGVAVSDLGGAIIVGLGANVVIQDCVFHDNTADSGGALYVTKPSTMASVSGCSFTGNNATTDGGAIRAAVGAVVDVHQCCFENNSAGLWGGAIHAGEGTTVNVSESLFNSNVTEVGGAIYAYRSAGLIQGSTFWRNHSPDDAGGTLTIDEHGGIVISRNIFAEDTAGIGIYFIWMEAPHDCNVFWNNKNGAIAGGGVAPDEVLSDPLFCSALSGNFTISAGSPAAASNSACGLLIGAYEVGCGAVAVRESTWGRIKSMYAPTEN